MMARLQRSVIQTTFTSRPVSISLSTSTSSRSSGICSKLHPFHPPTFSRARSISSSSCNRQSSHSSKVVALPFRLSSSQLNEQISELALTSAHLLENSVFQAALYLGARILTKALGIDAFFGLEHGSIRGGVRKVRERSIYLPIWVVDASFEVACKGEAGEATAHFATLNSTFPGHSWTAMHSFPIKPPQPELLNSSGSVELPPINLDIAGEAMSRQSSKSEANQEQDKGNAPLKYQPWSPDLLKPTDSKGRSILNDGEPATLLPFTGSPLSLESLLRGESPSQSSNLMRSEDFEVEVESDHPSTLRFDRASIKSDLLACYPVLMPIHLIQYEYDKPQSQNSTEKSTELLSFGTSAFSSNSFRFAVRKGKGEWLMNLQPRLPFPFYPLDLLTPAFFPKIPISDPNETKGEAGKVDFNTSIRSHVFREGYFPTLIAKAIKEKVASFFASSQKLSKFWSSIESIEKQRLKKEIVTHSQPPRQSSDLGRNIDWEDVRVQRLDKDAIPNRRYLTSLLHFWAERTYVTGVEMRANSKFVLCRTQPKSSEGVEERKKSNMVGARDYYLEALKASDEKTPAWLKKYRQEVEKKKGGT